MTELETQVRAEQSKVREEKNKVGELQRELERKERKADATNVGQKLISPKSVLVFFFSPGLLLSNRILKNNA